MEQTRPSIWSKRDLVYGAKETKYREQKRPSTGLWEWHENSRHTHTHTHTHTSSDLLRQLIRVATPGHLPPATSLPSPPHHSPSPRLYFGGPGLSPRFPLGSPGSQSPCPPAPFPLPAPSSFRSPAPSPSPSPSPSPAPAPAPAPAPLGPVVVYYWSFTV